MVVHTLLKVFAMTLDEFISNCTKTHNRFALGQDGFRRNYYTIDHILSLCATIKEAHAKKQKVYCCFVDFHKTFDTLLRHPLF